MIHLRLPMQLVLSPFMLWGAALAHARISLRFVAAFLVLHVSLYGGTTAFNSHYDRDEGPIGGLERPPPPGPLLLPGSLALQGAGLCVAALLDVRFFVLCVAFALLGFCYSHPRTRWKARPWWSWAVVMAGQGGLGAAAGVVFGSKPLWTVEVALGLTASAALVGALYPLSQLFQTGEDRARGDRTAAMVLGRRGCFLACSGLALFGSAAAGGSAFAGGRRLDAVLLTLASLPMIGGAAWVCLPAPDVEVFRRVSRVQLGAFLGFATYAVLRLVGVA